MFFDILFKDLYAKVIVTRSGNFTMKLVLVRKLETVFSCGPDHLRAGASFEGGWGRCPSKETEKKEKKKEKRKKKKKKEKERREL